jgi:hypothetical protein
MGTATKKTLSQLDGIESLRSSHDDDLQAHRVANIGDNDDFEVVTYDVNNNPTLINYYVDQKNLLFSVGFVGDSAGSLNNTYWLFSSPKDGVDYYVWYSVSGGGVDPAVANRTGIQVDIETNDPSFIVAQATKLFLEQEDIYYKIQIKNSVLEFEADLCGVTTEPSPSTSGFLITTNQQGSRKLVKTIKATYDVNCNILTRSIIRYE